MIYRYLSHPLMSAVPVYGGVASIECRKIKAIEHGNSANTFSFTMENHWGTHIDSPNHFFSNGQKIADYPPEFWLFKSPQVIRINLEPAEILICGSWIEAVKPASDILLLKSMWSNFRWQDIYGTENPGIHPDVAFYLREKFPNIRAIGIDWISVSSYKERNTGRETHRAFLDPDGLNHPILIIEDMDMSFESESLEDVFAVPLRIDCIDSAPCTVIGGFGD